jgi:hypothetical protein
MISILKKGLSTETSGSLSTTTTLFIKKEDKKTGKPMSKNKKTCSMTVSFSACQSSKIRALQPLAK